MARRNKETAAPSDVPRLDPRLASATLLVLTLVLYWPVGGFGPVSFDDPAYVTSNPSVLQGLTGEGLRWALTESHSHNWHPLTWLSHMLDVDLFGADYGKHHLVSVGLHGLSGVLLFLWLGRATERWWSSFFLALFFLVHPLNVESVAWLSERKSTLSGAFFFATLLVWTERARALAAGRSGWRLYLLAVTLGLLGLLSKPMLVTLPFVLLLVDFWPLGRWPGRADPVPLGRLLLEKIPFFVMSAGSIVMTLRAQQGVVQTFETFPLIDRLTNAVASYFRYILQVFTPGDLAVFYPFAPVPVAWAAGLVAVLVAATVVFYRFRESRPEQLFGWLWYLGLLVPVIGLVQVGLQSMADRYAYLPMLGLALPVVWLLVDLVPGSAARLLAVAGAVPLLVLSSLTRQQIGVWQDDRTLYSNAASVEGSFWGNYNLGLVEMREERVEQAIEAFREAQRIDPENVETLRNLGHLLRQQGDLSGALELFAQAVVLRPEDLYAALDLAQALFESERFADAEELLARVVAQHDDSARAWQMLGSTRIRRGRLLEAEAPLRRAIDLEPDDPVSQNALGVSLAQRTLYAEAVPYFERAVELEQSPDARRNLEAARALAEGRPPPK